MSARTPEGAITTKILAYLNRLPCTVAHKVAAGPYQQRGEPDIDCVHYGRAVKLEVKRPGTEAAITKSVTPLQRQRLIAYDDAGALVGVVTSIAEVQDLLDGVAGPTLPAGEASGGLRHRWDSSVRSSP